MGLIEALRSAEKQGRGVAQRGLDAARAGWEDAETRIRRKMRIFPATMKRKRAGAAAGDNQAGATKPAA